MTEYILYGKYTAAFWDVIRENPENAPLEIRKHIEIRKFRLEHFYFALGEYEFYAVISGGAEEFGILRHELMANGIYRQIHANKLHDFAGLFPIQKAGSAEPA